MSYLLNCTLALHYFDYQRNVYSYENKGLMKLGKIYADRHLQLARCYKENRSGHRIIAFIENCPLLGVLAALIEKFIVLKIAPLLSSNPYPLFARFNPVPPGYTIACVFIGNPLTAVQRGEVPVEEHRFQIAKDLKSSASLSEEQIKDLRLSATHEATIREARCGLS